MRISQAPRASFTAFVLLWTCSILDSRCQTAVADSFDKIQSEVWRPGGGSSKAASEKPDTPPHRKNATRASHANHEDYCDDDVDSFFGKAFLAGITSPFWVPRAALNDDLSQAGYFPEHPYENADGSLLLDKNPRGAHDSLIVLQGQYGSDFDSISHANGRVLMENSSRFGIDSEFFYRNEAVPTGHAELWTGDANLTYRFAQNENWQFRAGLGANWLTYKGKSDSGINFTYGTDWFPSDPWVVSGVLDWGRVGDAGLFHGRTTIGVSRNGWGVFTGYDFFEIGHQEMHAWVNGIELRF
ncbi:MAG: hypothetical protein HQ518_28390 [Rhodopirellula sp.]|nr:hypothetical protein [Rhodopirellula sp.]